MRSTDQVISEYHAAVYVRLSKEDMPFILQADPAARIIVA